jgi:hypothetical protein
VKIVLEYRDPNPVHCDVAIFVNNALAGVIKLRQDEVGSFQQILSGGCVAGVDEFLSKGKSLPE